MPEIQFRYFRSVEGRVVPRYGTQTYIGVRPDKDAGWVWNPAAVVRIPETEAERYLREYRRALSDGSIIECTRADYDAREAQLARDVEAPRRKPRKGEEE